MIDARDPIAPPPLRRPDLPPPPAWAAGPPRPPAPPRPWRGSPGPLPGWEPRPSAQGARGPASPFPAGPPTEWPPPGPPPSPGGWLPPAPPPPPAAPAPGSSRPGLSVQNLLLGLGTGLVAIAALVFAVVTWDRLDATTQGLVLLGCTVLAGAAATASSRRSMPATAEALGLVTLLLALVDVHAARLALAPSSDAATWWAVALAAVAGGAWVGGEALRIRSTRIAAAVLVQLPLLLSLDHLDGVRVPVALVLGQAAAVVHVALGARRAPIAARALAVVVALWQAAFAAMVAVGDLIVADRSDRAAAAIGVALAAALALSVSVRGRRTEGTRVLGLLLGAPLAALATAGALSTAVCGDAYPPVLAAMAVLALAVASLAPRRWGQIPGWTAGVTGALAMTPLVAAAVVTAAGAAGVADRTAPGSVDAATRAIGLVPGADHLASSSSLAALLVLAGLAVAAVRPRTSSTALVPGLVGVGLVGVLVAPVLLPLSVGGTAALALAAAALLVGLAGNGPRLADRAAFLVGAAAGPAVLALAWAAASDASAIATTVGAVLVAAGAVHAGRRAGAAGVTGASVVATVALVAVAATRIAIEQGATGPLAAVVGSIAALVLALVVALAVDPEGTDADPDATSARLAEGTAWVAHLLAAAAVLAEPRPGTATVLLASGCLAAGLHAARRGRRPLAALAVAEGLILSWLRLGEAGVTVIEAYTLPVALVLLAGGLWTLRRAPVVGRHLSSWVVEGPALVVAFAPTVLIALQDPGLVRPLIGLVAGAIVLSIGAFAGRRAMVDVGTGVVVLLGLEQVAPVVGGLPNWVTIGSAGVLLLAVGATFEQRRRDLREVRDRYASLV